MALINKTEIESQLEHAIELYFSDSPLRDAIRYALIPPGKLLRPHLSATLARELGWAGDLSWIVSLEFLHVASLIHDDLPALDNDDLRRGRAALHRQFDQATAILAADALIAAAHTCVLAQDAAGPARLKVLAAAFVALCNGQRFDLKGEGCPRREMFRLKTGALFGACFEMAYLTAHPNSEDRLAFRTAGENLGIAFQEIDDLNDAESTGDNSVHVSIAHARKLIQALAGVGQESLTLIERCLNLD